MRIIQSYVTKVGTKIVKDAGLGAHTCRSFNVTHFSSLTQLLLSVSLLSFLASIYDASYGSLVPGTGHLPSN